MANTQAICDSFRVDLLNGTHAFGAQGANGVRLVTTKDVFKAALYFATATAWASRTVATAPVLHMTTSTVAFRPTGTV